MVRTIGAIGRRMGPASPATFGGAPQIRGIIHLTQGCRRRYRLPPVDPARPESPHRLPDNWFNRMTVCIAVRSVGILGPVAQDFVPSQRIISICDRMLTFPDYAVDDIVLKKREIHPRWRAMYSCNDTAPITPMSRLIEASLKNKDGTLEEIVGAFRIAFERYVQELARNTILGKYGHNISSWKEAGLKEFGPDEFARINQLIERLYTGVDFLVYGFEPSGQPHIFRICEDFTQGDIRLRIEPHDDDGLAVIGSGTMAALSGLLRKPIPKDDLYQAIYRVCEAKLLAEKAPGVGKGTVLTVLELLPSKALNERYVIPDWEAMRTAWEDESQPIAWNAVKLIELAFKKSTDWDTLLKRLQAMTPDETPEKKKNG